MTLVISSNSNFSHLLSFSISSFRISALAFLPSLFPWQPWNWHLVRSMSVLQWRSSYLLSRVLIEMLTSSPTKLTDIPRIKADQISRYSMAHSNWHWNFLSHTWWCPKWLVTGYSCTLEGHSFRWKVGRNFKRNTNTYGWFVLICSRNQHNTVKQLSFN